MNDFKKDDIVVFLPDVAKPDLYTKGCWDNDWLFKVNEIEGTSLRFITEHPKIKDTCANRYTCFRHATQTEINAYNRGIRNINDIPKTIDYEVYG